METILNPFIPDANEGKDKVTDLKNAIKEHVKPEMNIYITPEGNSGICELIRQFQGTKPAFVLTMAGTIEHALNLVHCGLIKKLITTNGSHLYPSPTLSRIVQDSYKEKKIEVENWSLYTFFQRLMAGALGVGFLPTHSLLDSSMAQENQDSFLTIDDPFGSTGKIGLVKALNPDIAIVHGWAADRYGNTIGVPMSSQAITDHKMWGARASKNGVIVTVEKVVSTDFIRKYSSLVTLPGYLVKSVCQVAWGAHPQGMFSPLPDLFDSYAPDYDFLNEHKEACQDPLHIDSWIKKWIFDCHNQNEFIKKLGPQRIKILYDKANPNCQNRCHHDLIDKMPTDKVPNATEIMILTAARRVAEIVQKNNYKIVLGGMGAGMLSSWIAYYLLREKKHDLDLVIGTGAFGFAPKPGDPFYGTYNNLPSCKAFFDTADIYGSFIAGNNKSCLSILGAAQVDKFGNINSTKANDAFLMGSGGANDAVNASEVLIVAKQSRQRFVDKVSYITCPGRNVRTLVSDLGIFQKIDQEQELKLVACLPDPGKTRLQDKIQKIKENCGWPVKVSDKVKEYSMPEGKALSWLRLFDPEGLIINK